MTMRNAANQLKQHAGKNEVATALPESPDPLQEWVIKRKMDKVMGARRMIDGPEMANVMKRKLSDDIP